MIPTYACASVRRPSSPRGLRDQRIGRQPTSKERDQACLRGVGLDVRLDLAKGGECRILHRKLRQAQSVVAVRRVGLGGDHSAVRGDRFDVAVQRPQRFGLHVVHAGIWCRLESGS
jgi:hypothetical protein